MNKLTQFETLTTITALEILIEQKLDLISKFKIINSPLADIYLKEIDEVETIINKLKNTL